MFALAVTMLSSEFVSLFSRKEPRMISCTFETTQYFATQVHSEGYFDNDMMNSFSSSKYYKLIDLFWKSPEHKSAFLGLAKTYYPSIEEALAQKYSVGKPQVLDLTTDKIVLSSAKVFQKLILTVVDFAWNRYFVGLVSQTRETYKQKVSEIGSKLGGITQKDSEESLVALEELKFYQSLDQLALPEFEKKRELVRVLLSVVSTDGETEDPPSIEEFHAVIKNLRESFETENAEALDYIALYKRHYLSKTRTGANEAKSMASSGVDLRAFGVNMRLLI